MRIERDESQNKIEEYKQGLDSLKIELKVLQKEKIQLLDRVKVLDDSIHRLVVETSKVKNKKIR